MKINEGEAACYGGCLSELFFGGGTEATQPSEGCAALGAAGFGPVSPVPRLPVRTAKGWRACVLPAGTDPFPLLATRQPGAGSTHSPLPGHVSGLRCLSSFPEACPMSAWWTKGRADQRWLPGCRHFHAHSSAAGRAAESWKREEGALGPSCPPAHAESRQVRAVSAARECCSWPRSAPGEGVARNYSHFPPKWR